MRVPENIPPELLARNASNDMLVFTAIISVVIGCLLFWLGLHGRQMWMVAWSLGLVVCSIALGGWMLIYEP